MLLRIDRWWPQQLTVYYTASSLCNSITLFFPRTGLKSAARQTKCHHQAGGRGRGGAVGIQRVGFRGPVEEKEAQGRVAAAFIARPGSWTRVGPRARSAAAPGSCAPFRVSQPRLGDCGLPLAGRAASYWRATVPRGWFLCPGEWERLARIAQTSCTRRSRGQSPGAQSAVATTVHQRRLGQEEGDFRQGSLR